MQKIVELTGKSLSRGAAAIVGCRWCRLCGGGGDGHGESECLELADVAACLAVGVGGGGGGGVVVVAEVVESRCPVGEQVPDDEQGAGDRDQGLELAAALDQPPVSLAQEALGLPGGGGRVAQDEPLTFCMPCKSDLSGAVGWSPTESLSPAETIRAGRGESGAV
jgi:hypothetical protein